VTGLLRGAELLLGRDGDPNEALEVLEEARRLSPENTERAVLLARAETVLGRVDRAKEALRAVIAAHRGRRSRDVSLVYRELSTIELEEGDLSAALESLSKAFDLDSKNGDLAMQLGYLALDVDDPAAAAKAFRSVTMMRPKIAGSNEGASAEAKAVGYYHLARIAETQGDVRRARLMASKAVSENPNHAEAQALLQELTRVG
jgi:tetratricopeptide (TPR) repeat protein